MGEHRDQDARAADLDRREAAQDVRDELAGNILAAAAERDDEADQRDDVASERDRAADLAAFLAADGQSYGDAAPARRDAALDRMHSKDDRASAAGDRDALTQDAEPDGPPEP